MKPSHDSSVAQDRPKRSLAAIGGLGILLLLVLASSIFVGRAIAQRNQPAIRLSALQSGNLIANQAPTTSVPTSPTVQASPAIATRVAPDRNRLSVATPGNPNTRSTHPPIRYGNLVAPQVMAMPIQTRTPSESDRKILKLVQELRQTNTGKREPQKMDELKELLANQFDERHAAQVKRLEEVVANAERTEEILNRRAERKSEIVQRRAVELLGQRDPLNWDYRPNWPSSSSNRSLLGPATQPISPTYSYSRIYPPESSVMTPGLSTHAPRITNPPLATEPSGVSRPSRPTPATPPSNTLPGMVPAPAQTAPPSPTSSSGLSSPNPPGMYGQTAPENATPASGASGAMPPGSPQSPNVGLFPADGTTNFGTVLQPVPAVNVSGRGTRYPVSDDIISIGYRLREQRRQVAEAQRAVDYGIGSTATLERHKNSVLELETLWKFKKKELQDQLKIAEIEMSNAREQYSEASARWEAGTLAPDQRREMLDAKKLLAVGSVDVARLSDRLDWAEQFEETQIASSEEDAAEVEPNDPADEAAGSEEENATENAGAELGADAEANEEPTEY